MNDSFEIKVTTKPKTNLTKSQINTLCALRELGGWASVRAIVEFYGNGSSARSLVSSGLVDVIDIEYGPDVDHPYTRCYYRIKEGV